MRKNTIEPGYFSLPSHHLMARVRSQLTLLARKSMHDIFMRVIRPQKNEAVIDVGVTPHAEYPENNFFERAYPHPEQITAVSIEDASNIEKDFPGVTFVQTEPGPLPFKDKEFDILFCSAVLEHVGTRENQKHFIKELLRVSKKYFITTPNRWYPVDFHTMLPFVHWLPQRIHQGILRLLGFSFLAQTENLNLCSAADIRKMLPAGSDYRIRYKWFFGIPSNIIIHSQSTLPSPSPAPRDIYLRFFLLSGGLGIIGIALIEFIGLLFPDFFERFPLLIFSSVYLLSTAVNFIMQSVYTIQTQVIPGRYVPYLLFSITISVLCGGLASLFYAWIPMEFHPVVGIKSAACIAAVLMMSPLTCYGMVKILRPRSAEC